MPSISFEESPDPGRVWPPKTGQQIGALLAVFQHTGAFLSSGDPLRGVDKPEEAAREQAVKTFELVNYQLRNLLDDPTRWAATTPADELEDKVEEIEAALSQVKLDALRNLQRPSVILRATVRFVSEVGAWVCWTGELTNGALHGHGATPEEAMDRFDTVYAAGFPPPKSSPTPAQTTPKKPRHAKRKS